MNRAAAPSRKRPAQPALSSSAQRALEEYATSLREHQDLRPATIRNYLSDLRQFMAWYEASGGDDPPQPLAFTPEGVTTPTLTRYRSTLQTVAKLRPASVNRALVSLKGYFSWAVDEGLLPRDPARP